MKDARRTRVGWLGVFLLLGGCGGDPSGDMTNYEAVAEQERQRERAAARAADRPVNCQDCYPPGLENENLMPLS